MPSRRTTLRHGRERRDAAAAQRLQQEGLGLVAPMVGEQHEVDAVRQRHLAQRPIARLPRPGLDALAGAWRCRQSMRDELDRQTAARPAPAERRRVGEPGVGVRAQAMVHMQRQDLDAERRRVGERRVQQRGRVAAAAVGHGDDARAPRRSALFGVAEAAVGLQPLVAALQQFLHRLQVADLAAARRSARASGTRPSAWCRGARRPPAR